MIYNYSQNRYDVVFSCVFRQSLECGLLATRESSASVSTSIEQRRLTIEGKLTLAQSRTHKHTKPRTFLLSLPPFFKRSNPPGPRLLLRDRLSFPDALEGILLCFCAALKSVVTFSLSISMPLPLWGICASERRALTRATLLGSRV